MWSQILRRDNRIIRSPDNPIFNHSARTFIAKRKSLTPEVLESLGVFS